jgi:hypothetical protein
MNQAYTVPELRYKMLTSTPDDESPGIGDLHKYLYCVCSRYLLLYLATM